MGYIEIEKPPVPVVTEIGKPSHLKPLTIGGLSDLADTIGDLSSIAVTIGELSCSVSIYHEIKKPILT